MSAYSCQLPQSWLARKLGFKPRYHHIWLDGEEETLGLAPDRGDNSRDLAPIFRIARHQECICCGEKRIIEFQDYWPSSETPEQLSKALEDGTGKGTP